MEILQEFLKIRNRDIEWCERNLLLDGLPFCFNEKQLDLFYKDKKYMVDINVDRYIGKSTYLSALSLSTAINEAKSNIIIYVPMEYHVQIYKNIINSFIKESDLESILDIRAMKSKNDFKLYFGNGSSIFITSFINSMRGQKPSHLYIDDYELSDSNLINILWGSINYCKSIIVLGAFIPNTIPHNDFIDYMENRKEDDYYGNDAWK